MLISGSVLAQCGGEFGNDEGARAVNGRCFGIDNVGAESKVEFDANISEQLRLETEMFENAEKKNV